MSKLTDEERAELAQLEKEEASEREDATDEKDRQRIAALKTKRRLAKTLGKPGTDFAVLETTLGNFVIRRPTDVEVDRFEEGEGREAIESFAKSITVEPSGDELVRLMAEHQSVGPTIVREVRKLLEIMRGEEAKK